MYVSERDNGDIPMIYVSWQSCPNLSDVFFQRGGVLLDLGAPRVSLAYPGNSVCPCFLILLYLSYSLLDSLALWLQPCSHTIRRYYKYICIYILPNWPNSIHIYTYIYNSRKSMSSPTAYTLRAHHRLLHNNRSLTPFALISIRSAGSQ